MSNYSRRPLSSRPSAGLVPCDTQKELKSRLAEEGFTLVSYRKNVGNWNESRDWFAKKGLGELWLENTSKGDRPDWAVMWKEFEQSRELV
jgi:hypothetical protein